MSKNDEPIKFLNKLLGDYYQLQGDSSFYDKDGDGKGKFEKFCDENGAEDHKFDDVKDELEEDPEACIYSDFDKDFPIDKSLNVDVTDETERLTAVFNVIKYCWQNEKAPRYFSALNIELTTTEDDMKTAESQYTDQCPIIFGQSKEEILKEMFAIGLKNDFPFISYLVDSYQRDRMLSKGQDLDSATWLKKSPYIKKVSSKSKKQSTAIGSGIESYMKRVAPKFHWKAMNKVQDDIQSIVKYFVTAGQFVESLIQSNQSTPFAYDVVIVVKKTVSNTTMVMPNLSDDDDDEEDDEPEVKEDENSGKDYFSNVAKQLKSNDCTFISKKLKGANRGARFMMQTFKEFSSELGNSKYKDKPYDMKQYPRKKRFCAYIDRRGDSKDEDLLMFEPPDANTLPDKHVPEWYFNAAKTVIIPSEAYKSNQKTKDFDIQETITADHAYKGRTLTLSFHVDDEESVRCYLFWNGCYIRIVYPQDLKKILLSVFDIEYKDNKSYLEQKADDDLNKLNVKDDTFDAFYKEVSVNKKG